MSTRQPAGHPGPVSEPTGAEVRATAADAARQARAMCRCGGLQHAVIVGRVTPLPPPATVREPAVPPGPDLKSLQKVITARLDARRGTPMYGESPMNDIMDA